MPHLPFLDVYEYERVRRDQSTWSVIVGKGCNSEDLLAGVVLSVPLEFFLGECFSLSLPKIQFEVNMDECLSMKMLCDTYWGSSKVTTLRRIHDEHVSE